MKTPPVNPTASATPDALRDFLGQCSAAARACGRPQLVSISVAVDNLDPLAVLESIFDPTEQHFYAERPADGFSVAGAEAVLEFAAAGPDRFAAAKAFIERTLADTIAIGPLEEPFAGPHFFFAVGFGPEAAADAPFGALKLFVPRWQVARRGDSTVAVANFVITADSPVEQLTARVWKAHAKFGAFDYSRAKTGRGIGRRRFLSARGHARPCRDRPGRLCEGRAGAGVEIHDRRGVSPDGCVKPPAPPLSGLLLVLDRQRPGPELHRRHSRASRPGRRRSDAHDGPGRLRRSR